MGNVITLSSCCKWQPLIWSFGSIDSFLTAVAYPWCTIMSLFSIVIVFRWGQCREEKNKNKWRDYKESKEHDLKSFMWKEGLRDASFSSLFAWILFLILLSSLIK